MTDHPMQAMLEEMSRGWRAQRSLTQLTLGKTIELLKTFDGGAPIVTIDGGALSTLGSYRGYYSDLAWGSGSSRPSQLPTVGAALANATAALGATFEGYKGGDFLMDKHTPMWVSGYGTCSGLRVMGIEMSPTNMVVLMLKSDEEND